MYVIKLQGQVIYRTESEQLATVQCIALRRAGWGLVYVEGTSTQ